MDYLRMATDELYAAHQENTPEAGLSRALRVLDDLIRHLESQQQETPQSGPTSRESEPASQVVDTPSTPETGISGLTSSPSGHGRQWEVRVSRPTPAQKSKTTAPTSSTPATDRNTGRSASIDECYRFTEVGGCACGTPLLKWQVRPHRTIDGALALACPYCDKPLAMIEPVPSESAGSEE